MFKCRKELWRLRAILALRGLSGYWKKANQTGMHNNLLDSPQVSFDWSVNSNVKSA